MDGNGLFWRTALLIVTTTALLVAGCTDGGNTAPTPPPTVTFSTDVATTPGMAGMPPMSGMPATSAAGGGGAAAGTASAAPQGPNSVEITDFAFAPVSLTVKAGTTVTWTNRDEEPHTVAADDGSFHSPGMGTGNTYTYTFTTAGTFAYVCSIHPMMHGTVVVTP